MAEGRSQKKRAQRKRRSSGDSSTRRFENAASVNDSTPPPKALEIDFLRHIELESALEACGTKDFSARAG